MVENGLTLSQDPRSIIGLSCKFAEFVCGLDLLEHGRNLTVQIRHNTETIVE